MNEENLDNVFHMLDADGDGKISKEELGKSFLGAHEHDVKAMVDHFLEEADEDGDG